MNFFQRHCVHHISISGEDIKDLLIIFIYIIIKVKKYMNIIIILSLLLWILYCYFVQNFEQEEKEFEINKDEETKEWELPDNRKIKIGKEKFQSSEIWFKPKKYVYEYSNFKELFQKTVKSIDSDLREIMLAIIIINGGTILI